MTNTTRILKLALLSGMIAVLGGCGGTQPADSNSSATASTTPAVTRVRGVVEAIDAKALTVRTYDGQSVSVPVDATTGFAWVVNSSLSELKNGDFIGTATTGPDDALRAVELVIFPEAMRGTGEGHYPWDVPGVVASAGGGTNGSSSMTNGTVDQQSAMTNGTVDQQSTMTNGTVTGGAAAPGETKLTISYKGGKAQVVVPANIPVVRFEPTTRAVLAKGQRVFAVMTAGKEGAKSVAIGKDGITPPM
ncbi:hypothetical protein [Sphingomonas prati]|uniref:Cu/Ag efflux protein CusF n=1 Tax=Sphingomonas prati TaxID=1843237 RepID=A0A7W9F2S6_9SPHN|nr:hypothetical protein [Sphingomonas prati]MBB5730713.1 Cu/Ag efflux protein CusF [Sphingomonas prati]GGE95764.1 hypothetical protein GCM10011404_31130 [Sphingomonas prati]